MIWLDILFIVIALAALTRGLLTGLVLQAASLAGIILGAIFCGKVAEYIYPHLIGIIGNSENVTSAASYILGFIIILVVVNLIGRAINTIADSMILKPINRVLGGVFCLAKWLLISSIILNLVIQIDTDKSIIKEEVREKSHTYPILIDIAQTVIPYLRFEAITPSPNEDNQSPQAVFV